MHLRDMWSNDDEEKSLVSKSILDGELSWLEQGTIGLPYSVEQLRPETMESYLKTRKPQPRAAEPTQQLPRTGTE